MRLAGLDIALPGTLSQAGRSAAEGALALAAGLMLARLAWIAAGPESGAVIADMPRANTPHMATQSAAAPAGNILLTSNPFRAPPAAEELSAPPTSLNLKLTGLRSASSDEQGGSAIILLPDGSHKRFEPGQLVVSGATLEAVTADRVFLRVNGRLEELTRPQAGARALSAPDGRTPLPQAGSVRPAGPAPAPAGARSPAVTPALLMSDLAFQPETRNGQVSGYRVNPRGQGHFEQAGLEPGDLVLRVNGQSLEGMRPDMIQSAIGAGNDVALDVVRHGMIVRVRLTTDTGLAQ
ncbi:type II secretion system protein N [Hyphomonas sp.]|uniref:type II secretion system protein N n=1 Tax=Hyphomonas sp. TaxID=87 RepID=UPI00391D88A4